MKSLKRGQNGRIAKIKKNTFNFTTKKEPIAKAMVSKIFVNNLFQKDYGNNMVANYRSVKSDLF